MAESSKSTAVFGSMGPLLALSGESPETISEQDLNSLGYSLLRAGKPAEAIARDPSPDKDALKDLEERARRQLGRLRKK